MQNNVGFMRGRLAREPYYQDKGNTPVALFTLAIDKVPSKDSKGKPGANFIPVKAYGNIATFVGNNLKQGDLIAVQYYLNDTRQPDKNTGETVYGIEVVVRELDAIIWGNMRTNGSSNTGEPDDYSAEFTEGNQYYERSGSGFDYDNF